MQSKIIKAFIIFISLTSNMVSNNPGTFNYSYQIKGNSFNPLDTSTAYYYKEEMIDKYDEYILGLDEESLIRYVTNNIEFFKLYDNVKVSNIGGTICITLGKGNGLLIKGKFKKNECDLEAVNEKYFLLEIFKKK